MTFFALNEFRDCFVGRSAGEEEAEGREEPRGEYAMEPVVKSRFPARSAMALSSVAVHYSLSAMDLEGRGWRAKKQRSLLLPEPEPPILR